MYINLLLYTLVQIQTSIATQANLAFIKPVAMVSQEE